MNPEDILAVIPQDGDPSVLAAASGILFGLYLVVVAIVKLTPTKKDDEVLAKAQPVVSLVSRLLSRRAK